MRKDLVTQWKEDIIGDWRAERIGVDLLYLKPAAGRFDMGLVFRADGTADLTITVPRASARPAEAVPPFPTTWKLAKDRVLSILIPIAPMPEYGMPGWTREEMRYDVLAVTDLSLALSNWRFDGEQLIVLRRMNRAEYDRRRAAEYGQVLESLKKSVKGM